MFYLIRRQKIARAISLQLILCLLFQLISPNVAWALTSGPGQEEFASFEPASTTDMVDLYSGDFNYNIPLLSVPGPNGGYPINLAYHSGIGMDQEASWVGLGWTLNVGAISRNLRGLPDDFGGDKVTKTQHVKQSMTTSLDIPVNAYREFIGFPTGSGGIGDKLQVYYNNYKGLGTRYTFSATMGNGSSSLGLNISHDSQNGMGIGLSFSVAKEYRSSGFSGGFGLGADYNSRQGLQSFNFSSSSSVKSTVFNSAAGEVEGGPSSSLSFETVFGVPKTNTQTKSTAVPFKLMIGLGETLFRFRAPVPISGSVSWSQIENNGVEQIPAAGYLNTVGSPSILRDFSRQDFMYTKKIPHLPTSSFTYDLYTQTGQGTGSMFRPYLNTFGVLSDPEKVSKDRVGGFGFDIGLGVSTPPPGFALHIGMDINLGAGKNTSGPWTQIGAFPDLGTNLRKLVQWNAANGEIDYEPYYFQAIGEKTGFNDHEDQLNSFQGDAALRLEIQKEKNDKSWLRRHFKVSNLLVSNEMKSLTASLDGTNQTKQQAGQKRSKRATSIEALTSAQAKQYGFSKNVQYQVTGTGALVPKDPSNPGHHVSEMSMLQPDGMRYVYGLPAYNNKQIDNVFAVTEDAGSAANYPTATIHTGGSKAIGGINVGSTYDQYVSKNELPKYAHSWMLTSVLSADYLDLTGNGPTDDDFGYWVKFNYKKTATDYKWRVPYVKANYLDGTKNNLNDNKGSYTYGEKDIYVLESIETKTHIARFETSSRKDGYEAYGEFSNGTASENWGRGTQTMQKLDKIKLYTKREFAQQNPTPTKVINFEYSYDLCPNVLNNNGAQEIVTVLDAAGNKSTKDLNLKKGKLTLTKLFFTYQNSSKGRLSPYLFNYGNINDQTLDNPGYNSLNMDRWGNFRDAAAYGSNYPALENPYTFQEKPQSPAPWTLNKISLPTGGTLNIDYEADDYGYVENKQAMRMFDICYLERPGNPTSPTYADLNNFSNRYAATAASVKTEEGNASGGRNRVYFKLEKDLVQTLEDLGLSQTYISTLSGTDKNAWVNKLYLENLPGGYVSFKVYSKLKGSIYDYVKGYAEIEPNSGGLYTATSSTNSVDYGYFDVKNKKLATPNVSGMFISPFTLASIGHLQANRPDAIYGATAPGGGTPMAQILNLLQAIPAQFTDLMSTTIGFNNHAYLNDWGQWIKLNGFSTIRLCKADRKKIGGGVRVKKISLNDNWASGTTGASNSEYGQKYDYTKMANINGHNVSISSGVAYEPQVGGDESPLKSPIPYTHSIPLRGSYNLFMENPIMDSYYPGASVGYSKVTVESIAPDQAEADNNANQLEYSAAPITIHEFYTPKDFPIVFDKTDMNPGQPIRIPIMIPGLMTSFTTRQAKSQGYSLLLNDMAGKPKSITTKTRKNKQIISQQKFIYNTVNPYNEDAINQLSNKVKTLEVSADNNYKIEYTTSTLGQTHDMFIDMNEDDQEMKSFGVESNLDLHFTVPPPILLSMIMPIPTIKIDESSMRTVVFNKVINRTGILKQVITTTNESTIITENLAYDIETGEPILTKVTNEFKDPIYNFAYPGHWYYPNMAGAYKNFGLKIDPPGNAGFTSNTAGYLNLSSVLNGRKAGDFFAKGDLLFVNCAPGSGQFDGEYHVFAFNTTQHSSTNPQHSILLMNAEGRLFPGNTKVESIQVLKSGFKNLQSTKVGALAFKKLDPSFENYVAGVTPPALMELGLANGTIDNKIISASAVEYNNDWQVFCGPRSNWAEACICQLNPSVYAFLGMLQNLNTKGLLFSEDVLLYDMVTDVYSNGFSSTLLNASQTLLNIKTSQLAGANNPKKFFYQGRLVGNSLYVLIYHDPNATPPDPEMINGDCIVKIDLPANANWGDIAFISQINADSVNCNTPLNLSLTLTKKDGTNINATTTVLPYCAVPCGCWVFAECYNRVIPNYACGIQDKEPVNPYWAGMKGMWRPQATYAYHTSRTQDNNLKEDGAFTDFVRFPWENPATKSGKWINAASITKYSPHGFELENKDALGNYSSALYGYKQSLVTAIGSNTRYNEIAVDNFEDYQPDCNDQHFRFVAATITKNQAHTGKYSLQAGPNTMATVQTSVGVPCTYVPIDDVSYPVPSTTVVIGTYSVAHVANECDCLGQFSPLPDKKYVASVWTKEILIASPTTAGVTQYTAPQLRITVSTGSAPLVYTFSPKGNVIDGWQQIFETFAIPANATGIKVELINTSNNRNVFFDDIRLHPNDGNMVAYVYDPITLKTMAELDANNFATIYIYDDEGHLNKVKKETSEGVKTIKEGRINTKSQ